MIANSLMAPAYTATILNDVRPLKHRPSQIS